MLKYEKDKLLNPHICRLYSVISDYMNTNDPYIHGVVFIEPSQGVSNQSDDEIIMPDTEPTYLVQTSIIEEITIEPSVGDWLFNNRKVLDIKSIPVDFSQHLLLKEISEEPYINKSPDLVSSSIESPDSRSRCDTIDNLGVVDYELENNPAGYRTRSSSSSLLLKKASRGAGCEEGSENEDEVSELSHSVSDLTMMKGKLSDYHPQLNKNFEVIKEEQTPRPIEEDVNEDEVDEEKEGKEGKEESKEKEKEKEERENQVEENDIEINDIHYENDNSTTTDTFDNNDNKKDLPPIPTSVGDLTARTASTNDIPSLPLKENCESKDEKEDGDENMNSTSVNADSSAEDSNTFSNDTSSELLTPSPIQQPPPPPPVPPRRRLSSQNEQQNIDDDSTSTSTPQIEPIPYSSVSSNDNPVDLRRSISIHHLKEVTQSDYQPALNLSIDVNDLPFSPCGQVPHYSYSYEGLSSPFTPTVSNVQMANENSPFTPFSTSNEVNEEKKDENNDQ